MPEVSHVALAEAIRTFTVVGQFGVESVKVVEVHEGKIVWQGEVQVFDLIDHPTATRCYAWSHEVDGSPNRRFVAVLHQGPVDSPEAAVKAAIVDEAKRPR